MLPLFLCDRSGVADCARALPGRLERSRLFQRLAAQAQLGVAACWRKRLKAPLKVARTGKRDRRA